eukprot:COSAG04_NODE_22919_length_347_cov_0.629032_1_plen_94_part_10
MKDTAARCWKKVGQKARKLGGMGRVKVKVLIKRPCEDQQPSARGAKRSRLAVSNDPSLPTNDRSNEIAALINGSGEAVVDAAVSRWHFATKSSP